MPNETTVEKVDRHLRNTYKGEYLSQKREELKDTLRRIHGHRYLEAIRWLVVRDLLEAVQSESKQKNSDGELTDYDLERKLKAQLENLEKSDELLRRSIKFLEATKSQVERHRLLRNWMMWKVALKSQAKGRLSFSIAYREEDFLNWLQDLKEIRDKLRKWDLPSIQTLLRDIHAEPSVWDEEAEKVNEETYHELCLRAIKPKLTDKEIEQRLQKWVREGKRQKPRVRRLAKGELLPKTQESILAALSSLNQCSVHSKKPKVSKPLNDEISLIVDILMVLNFQSLNLCAGKQFNVSEQKLLRGSNNWRRGKLYDKLRHLINRRVERN